MVKGSCVWLALALSAQSTLSHEPACPTPCASQPSVAKCCLENGGYPCEVNAGHACKFDGSCEAETRCTITESPKPAPPDFPTAPGIHGQATDNDGLKPGDIVGVFIAVIFLLGFVFCMYKVLQRLENDTNPNSGDASAGSNYVQMTDARAGSKQPALDTELLDLSQQVSNCMMAALIAMHHDCHD